MAGSVNGISVPASGADARRDGPSADGDRGAAPVPTPSPSPAAGTPARDPADPPVDDTVGDGGGDGGDDEDATAPGGEDPQPAPPPLPELPSDAAPAVPGSPPPNNVPHPGGGQERDPMPGLPGAAPGTPAPVPAPVPGPAAPQITPGAHDAASAARSRMPVPAGTPTLAATPVEAADHLSTDEILARSSAGIQAAAAAGAGGALTDGGSGGAIAEQLRGNLRTDAQGRTIFQRKIDSLEVERQQVLQGLSRGGDTNALVNRLIAIQAEQELLHREQEKVTELLRLVVSLMLGNVPTALVGRLCALGLRDVVTRIIGDAVGNGRSLSRDAIRALHGLASFGVTVSVTPEHQSEEAYREQDRERRRREALLPDGGQAAALWVRARRFGESLDGSRPSHPGTTWAPRVGGLDAGEPMFIRWNAASTGDSSTERP